MDKEIAERVREHQHRVLREFRNPQFEYFEKRFGRSVPVPLKGLYELKDQLFCHLFARDCGGEHPLVIRSLCPLTQRTVDYCEQFDFELFCFATGDDGEALFVSFDKGLPIYVQWDGDDPELTGLSFELLVKQILHEPPDRIDISWETDE